MHAIVAGALKQRILVIILAATLMVGGLFAYKTLNIEAYPDPVPPLVDIITQNPGQSSEEIERYITIPIEIQNPGRELLPEMFASFRIVSGESVVTSGTLFIDRAAHGD